MISYRELVQSILRDADGTSLSLTMENMARDSKYLLPSLADESCTHSERVAAGQLVHLLEGWTNFSSALSCLMRNELAQTKHLAYYGELRAVLSLLAWMGVNTQYDNLYYLKRDGDIQREAKPVRMHQFVWEFWNDWIRTVKVEKLLASNIKLTEFCTLQDIYQTVRSMSSVSVRLSTNWGVDLCSGASIDHRARNTSSYGISLASENVQEKLEDPCEFVCEVWKLLLPKSNTIWMFDVALIKYILGKSIKLAQTDEILTRAQIGSDIVRNFFKTDECLTIFNYAEKQVSNPKNMLSRCLILLRIATLAVVTNANGNENIKKWINNWLRNMFLNDFCDEPEISDVIYKVEDAIQQLTQESKDLCSKNLLSRPIACLAWGLDL